MRSSLGLKALGLCALVVGLAMAFVSVAQAEKGAFWLVNKEKISESLLPAIEAEKDTMGTLLYELGGKKLHLLCEKVLLVGAHLVEPLGKILGKAVFHECEFLELLAGGTTKKVGACTPEAEGSLGLIVSNKVEGLIKLHENGTKKDPVVEFTPVEPVMEPLFANISLGEECGFGVNLRIGGVWVVEDCELFSLEDIVKHLMVENKALSKVVVNGTHAATIDGSTWAFLGGLHKGMTWAGHPG